MKDIQESLRRAMVKQQWVFGDKVTRIGSPFEWSENEKKSTILSLEELLGVGFYYSMFYVEKPTPPEILIDEHDEVYQYSVNALTDSFRHFFPFLEIDKTWENHIKSQAAARTQDYCFIRKFCKDLPAGLNHLDIGPGLGSSGDYSLKFLDSVFYALEASNMSYSVQRKYFRFISPKPGAYLDVIECENFQLEEAAISQEVSSRDKYRIKHVPSWRFGLVPDGSLDLVTATFVLNELNYAGILWLLANVSRVLKKGGSFYIRDSFILKPGLHNINYDDVLQKIGFERTAILEFENRHDFFGIPRLYQKKTDQHYSFDEMVEMCLGKFASVASGAQNAYNMDKMPDKK